MLHKLRCIRCLHKNAMNFSLQGPHRCCWFGGINSWFWLAVSRAWAKVLSDVQTKVGSISENSESWSRLISSELNSGQKESFWVAWGWVESVFVLDSDWARDNESESSSVSSKNGFIEFESERQPLIESKIRSRSGSIFEASDWPTFPCADDDSDWLIDVEKSNGFEKSNSWETGSRDVSRIFWFDKKFLRSFEVTCSDFLAVEVDWLYLWGRTVFR